MEFQFGTNWATYSRFVGDVFGSALAAEGIFAFFLESGFLARAASSAGTASAAAHALLRDADGLPRRASSPPSGSSSPTRGCRRRPATTSSTRPSGPRAEIIDFWAMVFNPSSVRAAHARACWARGWLGAFLVMSVSAWYLLKRRHQDVRELASIRVAAASARVASLVLQVADRAPERVIVARASAREARRASRATSRPALPTLTIAGSAYPTRSTGACRAWRLSVPAG